MRLSRFNGQGVLRFREWLAEARRQPDAAPPYELLQDAELVEPVPGGLDIDIPDAATWWRQSDVEWIRKLRVAEELQRVLDAALCESIYSDQGLWAWLSLCFIDVLTVDAAGQRKLQNKDYYYILDVGVEAGEKPRRRYPYRHQLCTPYRVVSELGAGARFLLGADVRRHGEAVEQLLGRLRVLRIPAVVDVVTMLYYDPASPSGLKKGCMNKARKRKGKVSISQSGGLRDRFPMQVRRLQRNYDLYSIDAKRLSELLGSEFESWADADGIALSVSPRDQAGAAEHSLRVSNAPPLKLTSGVDPKRWALEQGVLGRNAPTRPDAKHASAISLARMMGRVGTSDYAKDPPTLYLNFASSDREHLPKRHKGSLALVIDGVTWVGTVGMPSTGANYTHTWFVGDGVRRRLSDLLHAKDVEHGDDVHFEVLERGKLRWSHVVTRSARD